MCKLERLLISSSAENIKTAGLVKTFRGKFFLCCQKMAGGLPKFLLLERVHAGGRVAFVVVPDGFDFDKDECCSIAGDNIEFSTVVSVIASYDFIALAQ